MDRGVPTRAHIGPEAEARLPARCPATVLPAADTPEAQRRAEFAQQYIEAWWASEGRRRAVEAIRRDAERTLAHLAALDRTVAELRGDA